MAAPSLAEVNRRLTAPGAPFEMEQVEVRGERLRAWRHASPTLRDLVLASRAHGDRTYLVYEDERLTYEETFRRVAALAHALVERHGIAKGDRVAIAMRNFPEWPLAFWAAACIGAIVVPLNAWWTAEELEYGLRDSGTALLFADAERAERLASRLPQLELRGAIVARPRSGITLFEDVIGRAASELVPPPVDLSPDDPATLFYTSGTTGRPKGALGTHRNLCTNVVSAAYAQSRALLRSGDELPDPADPQPPRAVLVSVPFFHVTGSHSILAGNTANGNKLVLMYRWDAERALELIERERIHSFGGVPSVAWQVLESPSFRSRDTSSVTAVGYGGAPAPPELVRRIAEELPAATPSNGYGMTETSAITTVNNGVDYVRKPDSIGPPVPVVDVKVIDADGRTLPPGEVGELCIRGPNVVAGYWNKPEATAETFRDGWLRSGDLARIDDEGFVYLVDRAKDMVIRGGENVYCVEVEDVLYAHPAVMDAAVVGLPHRVLGEEVGAAVQLAPGAEATERELRDHVAARLAHFKVPVRIDLRRDPLPRNPNGKILKPALRDELVASLARRG